MKFVHNMLLFLLTVKHNRWYDRETDESCNKIIKKNQRETRKGSEAMYQVTKRDGQIVDFNLSKISVAIEKAFNAQEKEYNQDIIDLLALKVTADFEPKIKNSLIQVEDIQDSVEAVLI